MRKVSIFRGLVALAMLSASAVAQAEQPSRRRSPPSTERACSPKVLQSSGYRDMLARFASRQSTNHSAQKARTEGSYRDFANRLPRATDSSFAGSPHAWRRYSLHATPVCG